MSDSNRAEKVIKTTQMEIHTFTNAKVGKLLTNFCPEVNKSEIQKAIF